MKAFVLLALCLGFVLLAGCAAVDGQALPSGSGQALPPGATNPVVDARATLAMAEAVLETQQASAWQQAVQATQVAMHTAQAAEAEMALISTAASGTQQARQNDFQIAQATEAQRQVFVRETDAAGQATAWASATAVIGTQQAVAATQEAVPTATYAAQLAAQQAQREIVGHYTGLAWRVIWPVGAALVFLALVLGILYLAWSNRDAMRRWLETRELRNRMVEHPTLGRLFVERLPDGRLVLYNPERLPGAAAIISAEGVRVEGLSDDPALTTQVLARAQAVELARSMPRRQVINGAAFTPPIAESGPVKEPQIEIVDAQVLPVRAWIEEVENRLLEGKEGA